MTEPDVFANNATPPYKATVHAGLEPGWDERPSPPRTAPGPLHTGTPVARFANELVNVLFEAGLGLRLVLEDLEKRDTPADEQAAKRLVAVAGQLDTAIARVRSVTLGALRTREPGSGLHEP